MLYYKGKGDEIMSCIEHFGHYDKIEEFPEHMHTSCEILYLHEGELTLYSGGREYEMKGGMVYIIPSCAVHRSVLKNRSVYRRTLVILNPWTYSRTYYSEQISNLMMGFPKKEPVVVADDFGGAALLEKIENELNAGGLLSEDIIVCAATELMAGIIRRSERINNSVRSPGKLVSDVERFIRTNCAYQIRISDIAEQFFISKFYLTHIFKEQTGMSPKQFLIYTRLSKACGLLHEKDLKISEISELCGFTSPSDMTKKFRERYGISPTQFRRKIDEKGNNEIV
jgi:AraC-like DNA-binding protein